MDFSVLTSRFTLVPAHFFNPVSARESLSEVVSLRADDEVKSVPVPQYDAVLVYAESASDRKITESEISGGQSTVRPEMFFLLKALPLCRDYNKIIASYRDSVLYLAIAQGRSLLLCNSFEAVDFTTALYFIFLSMNSLQLNPEVSTICWRTQLSFQNETLLYKYFKAVEQV